MSLKLKLPWRLPNTRLELHALQTLFNDMCDWTKPNNTYLIMDSETIEKYVAKNPFNAAALPRYEDIGYGRYEKTEETIKPTNSMIYDWMRSLKFYTDIKFLPEGSMWYSPSMLDKNGKLIEHEFLLADEEMLKKHDLIL